MSFQERRSLVNLISTLLVTPVYSAYMMQRFPEGDAYSPDVLHFWGLFFLILIPVTIVAKIVVYIIFYVANAIATREEEPSITDERDKLIELKAHTNSMYVFVTGFLVAMVSLAIELPPSAMFACLLCAGLVSEIVGDISTFYYYRRGF